MNHSELTADTIVAGFLKISQEEPVAILDSCGAGYLGSHLLLGAFAPLETLSLNFSDAERSLSELDRIADDPKTAAVFTISYEFGRKLLDIGDLEKAAEPDIFIHVFENMVVYDYSTGETSVRGSEANSSTILRKIREAADEYKPLATDASGDKVRAVSNFSRRQYIDRIERIKSHIRSGNTYQTNLTQRFEVDLAHETGPQTVYQKLRKSHPAAFSAFITRDEDAVVSISPERFVRIGAPAANGSRAISSSPIKGTRKRGANAESDKKLRDELLASAKDRAENTMIVDLIRNDLGRVCDYGSVKVEKLCSLEEHATLFHLVSTIRGDLRGDARLSDVLKATFPCGSITGCPKIRTMQIIEDLEKEPRALSMGAIGYAGFDGSVDMNVAIRTMVFREDRAVFNVGGGIVIDSDPEAEYRESLLKAEALFAALNAAP